MKLLLLLAALLAVVLSVPAPQPSVNKFTVDNYLPENIHDIVKGKFDISKYFD